jgi:hypothetical protein
MQQIARASAIATAAAVVRLPYRLFGSLVALVLIIFGRTQDDLAYAATVRNRQRLQDHVEPVALLMGEGCADREPEVVMALTLHDRERAIGGLLTGHRLPPFPLVGKSIFVGAHDGEHARRLLRVGRVFRAAFHVRGVVVHFEKVLLPGNVEVAEVMFAVWRSRPIVGSN